MRSLCSARTSVNSDVRAFVWQGDGTERGKMQVGVVGGSLAGQAAPAKQRVRCDGKVSTLFRQSHTLISDKSEKRASFRLWVHRVFVSPLHLHPTIIKVRAHQLRACIELAERESDRQREREREMMCCLSLPWLLNNEPLWHSFLSYLSAGRGEKCRGASYLGARAIFAAPCIYISSTLGAFHWLWI